MRSVQALVTLVVMVLATACAHQAPVAQVQLLSRAFTNVQTASQPLFDDLAAAERRQGQEVAVSRAHPQVEAPAAGDSERTVKGPAAPSALLVRSSGIAGKQAEAVPPASTEGNQTALEYRKCKEDSPRWQAAGPDPSPVGLGFIRGFCLEDAPYFSDLGDPPATRAFRTGVIVLGQYSEVLLVLAEGRNIEDAKVQIQSLGTTLAAGLALVPGAQVAAGVVVPVLTALEPVIEAAAQASNHQELRRIVIEAAPHFSRLVFALQIASREMFTTLTESSMAQATPSNLRGNQLLAETLVAQINGYRKVVSDFVVLLNELDEAHNSLVEALIQAKGQPPTLAGLADRAQRLSGQADALRQAYVILRRGKAP
jgi:hypothetical protein